MSEARGERRKIVIIGAGPGGICMGIKLKEAGFHDFTILDKADGVGGTWRHNTYPGCACDLPSILYSFTFERKPDWSRPYAPQPEILEYLEDCAKRYGLEEHLIANTEVRSATWSDADSRWTLGTADGRSFEADIVVSAMGMFNEPNWPNIPGLDSFAGPSFHSARWDHAQDLTGKRVAVIGSAASAVQLVPQIAPKVEHLYLYQRTANWILQKEDDPYTEEQLEAFRRDPSLLDEPRNEIWEWLESIITFSNPEPLEAAEENGRNALATVNDPALKEVLTPDHPFGAKRGLFSNDFYPALTRENVEVVTDPIRRIEPDGVVSTDGTHRRVDVLIFATGFETTRFLSAIDVTGRGGRRLEDDWADGAEAYLGITTPGYPNLFMLYGPNTNNGSIIYMIELQADYALRQIQRIHDEELAWLDVRADALKAYNRVLAETSAEEHS